MNFGAVLMLCFGILFALKSCRDKNAEIRRLELEAQSIPEIKREVWMSSCLHAVELSCYQADCAVYSIEQIQDKVCKLPEDL